jgi:hypothetical protein
MKEFFQEIGKAIRDFKFYKEVKDFQLQKSMKYIFFLILLITLTLTVRYSYDFRKGLNIAVNWALQNLPPIEIQNGIASVDVRQPYRIAEEDFALIIDTTGGITSLDEHKKGVLLMKNKVMYKESDIKTETYNLSNIESLKIDENFLNSLRRNATWILFPIMFIFLYIGFCIARFLQILLFSLISVATTSISNIRLNYKQLFNIGIYAITPSTVLGALLALFGIQLPLFGIIYSGMYIIYIIMAILTCKEEKAESAPGSVEMK